MPNTSAIETIDEPPRLNKGNGNPVFGTNPITVEILMIICIFRTDGLISFVPKNILERKKQRWKF